MDGSPGSPSEASGDPASPRCPSMQSPVSAHLHLFAGVHMRAACYKTRQRHCIRVPLLKLCHHLLSNTSDLLMKSKVRTCVDSRALKYVGVNWFQNVKFISSDQQWEQAGLNFLAFSPCHISELTCSGAVEIFSEVMVCDWMSTEMNISIDRHLKHTPRLVSQSRTASAAVLLKLDFEASPDLHIEEQLHRICRCFPPFSLRRCILRQPYIEFYHFGASWHHCEASSLLRALVFLTTKTLLLFCLTLPGLLMHFFKHVPSRVILVPAFGWHTKCETTHQAVRQTFSSNSIVFTINTIVNFSTIARVSDKQSCLDTLSMGDSWKA